MSLATNLTFIEQKLNKSSQEWQPSTDDDNLLSFRFLKGGERQLFGNCFIINILASLMCNFYAALIRCTFDSSNIEPGLSILTSLGNLAKNNERYGWKNNGVICLLIDEDCFHCE